MAYSLESTEDLTALANAIRSKYPTAGSNLTVSDMADKVSLIRTVAGASGSNQSNWTRSNQITVSGNSTRDFTFTLSNQYQPYIFWVGVSNTASGLPLTIALVCRFWYPGGIEVFKLRDHSLNFTITESFTNNGLSRTLTFKNNTSVTLYLRMGSQAKPSNETYASVIKLALGSYAS